VLRIKNVVKIANGVRERLRAGIRPGEAEQFRWHVRDCVERIEGICQRAGVTPDDLPIPSRKAYHFLKGIDLENLPLADGRPERSSGKRVGIKNVVRNKQAILRQISRLARDSELDGLERERIADTLGRVVGQIEDLCERQGGSPADLPGPSRASYALMKFLSVESNLDAHLAATRRTLEIARDVAREREEERLRVDVEFDHMGSLWQCKRHGNGLAIRIDEGFIRAEDRVLEAIVRSMIVKRTRARKQVVEGFVSSEEYTDVVLELDLVAEVTAEEPRGVAYDLDELFDAVNRDYFGGQMSRPRLAWTRRLTSSHFGHYEPIRDRVVLSLTLDDRSVPRFVVQYILYHELLHRQHPARWVNGRYRSHTSEFRREERKFRRYDEAEQWLGKLAAS
jgi:hypothetical protein